MLAREIRRQLHIAALACVATGLASQQVDAFDSVVQLSSLDGTTGFRLEGASSGDIAGRFVSKAGDFNGDGIDDVLISAPYADYGADKTGSTYVVFGTTTGFSSTINLSQINGTNGVRIHGASGADRSGWGASDAGDINGDGIDDLLIGARLALPGAPYSGQYAGSSFVVFGASAGLPSVIELSGLNGSNGFRLNGASPFDQSGGAVSSAGDVNDDGVDDVLIGAVGAQNSGPSSGSSYVVFGSTSPMSSVIGLSGLNGSNGFRLDGESSFDSSGIAVSNAGDVNGDGVDDLIIGARTAPSGSYAGASYVVFGKSSGFLSSINLSTLDGANGFRLVGENANDYAGWAVSGAGDVNGDGIDDLLIGAQSAGGFVGSSYVVFGDTGGFASSIELSTLNGTNGFRLDGAVPSAFGRAVSEVGDINNDGVDDLLVGAYFANFNGSGSGSVYAIFGSTSGFSHPLNVSALDGIAGFRMDGEAIDYRTGLSVSGAGDVNGDGINDLIMGSYAANVNGTGSGAGYVVFGMSICNDQTAIAADKWAMIGIPCDPGPNNTVGDIFDGDLDASKYLTDWVVWKRDAFLDSYQQLAVTDTLEEGDGVWIFSTVSSSLQVGSTPRGDSQPNNLAPSECLFVDGCYELDLEPPTSGGTTRFNLIGHPNAENIDWANVRFIVNGGAPLTPDDAETANFVSKTYFVYNGSSYESYDDDTPGMEGTLSPYDGIWIEVLDGAVGMTVQVLIPFSSTLAPP